MRAINFSGSVVSALLFALDQLGRLDILHSIFDRQHWIPKFINSEITLPILFIVFTICFAIFGIKSMTNAKKTDQGQAGEKLVPVLIEMEDCSNVTGGLVSSPGGLNVINAVRTDGLTLKRIVSGPSEGGAPTLVTLDGCESVSIGEIDSQGPAEILNAKRTKDLSVGIIRSVNQER
jgi:hypothetical protein